MTTTDAATVARRRAARAVALIAAALVAVALLAVGIPTLQSAAATRACARLGGHLQQTTEAVEPLVKARTVYLCSGPGGTVLRTW